MLPRVPKCDCATKPNLRAGTPALPALALLINSERISDSQGGGPCHRPLNITVKNPPSGTASPFNLKSLTATATNVLLKRFNFVGPFPFPNTRDL